MKILLFAVICSVTSIAYAQDIITGSLFDYKSGEPVIVNYTTDTPEIFLGDKHKSFSYKIDKRGNFTIPLKDLNSLDNRLVFSIANFSDESANSLADMDILNIPKDSLKLILKKVFVRRAYWTTYGGKDNFIINNKKTFSDSGFVVSNGYIKYKVKRVPEVYNQRTLAVKYITDLQTDVIK